MYVNTTLKYHRITDTQSCVITKVFDLLGHSSYMRIILHSLHLKEASVSVVILNASQNIRHDHIYIFLLLRIENIKFLNKRKIK